MTEVRRRLDLGEEPLSSHDGSQLGFKTFSATFRSCLMSSAIYTFTMPPSPISRVDPYPDRDPWSHHFSFPVFRDLQLQNGTVSGLFEYGDS